MARATKPKNVTVDDLLPPKMGRGSVWTEEKERQLKAICRLKPRLKDCADFLEVSEDTIALHIKKTYHVTFTEFRDQHMVHTRFMIIRKILQMCENGNKTMLIWASKNLCGWSDKHEATLKAEGSAPLTLNYSLDDDIKQIKE